MTEDSYESRARKRPAGASHTVQLLYGLLVNHPEGVTRDQAVDYLADRMFPTDAYRAYARRLSAMRDAYSGQANPDRLTRIRPVPASDSPEFRRAAQRWYVLRRLSHMDHLGTARRDGDLWFVGDRAPTVLDPRTHRLATYRPEVVDQLNAEQAEITNMILRVKNHANRMKDRQLRADLLEMIAGYRRPSQR